MFVLQCLSCEEQGAALWTVHRPHCLCGPEPQLLEQVGCVCYKADHEELALKLFRADEEIGVVILDYEMSVDDLGEFAEQLVAIRPGVKIVGTSAEDHRRTFRSMSIERYLDKGWHIADLIAAVDT